MTEQNIFRKLTAEELRQLANEMLDRMSEKERADFMEWLKKDFPEIERH